MNSFFFLCAGAIVVILFLLLFSMMEVSKRTDPEEREWEKEKSRHADWIMSTLEQRPDGTRKVW